MAVQQALVCHGTVSAPSGSLPYFASIVRSLMSGVDPGLKLVCSPFGPI